MENRSSSPEIDVVGNGDRSGSFRHRSERSSTSSDRNATNAQANQNGANRLAANTNRKDKNKVETVNLRVRNMGIINVKKEPESDEDCEVSYSLSSLLEECDFEQAPRKKTRALKSPTSLAIARSKSVEAARPVLGRPRQTLENVISSLKSARETGTSKPKSTNGEPNFQNPVVPISMPSHIVSMAPTPYNSLSLPSSGAQVGTGPQIVDVRSLATGPHIVLTGAATRATLNLSTSKPIAPKPVVLGSRPLNMPVTSAQLPRAIIAGPAKQSTPNTHVPVTKPLAQGSQVQMPTVKPATSGPKPLNIRFVLPATVPFNTSEFQQVLQAALASVVSQSKGVDANLLQQAIQGALITVAKSSQPLSILDLKQAIQNSLAALQATSSTSSVVPRQQVIAPKPPSTCTGNVAGLSIVNQISSPTTVTAKNTSPIVHTGSQLTSGVVTSSPTQSSLDSARDALVRALQEKRVLNTPQTLTSATLPSTSNDSPSNPELDSIDEPCSVSPPPSPVMPIPQDAADSVKSNIPASSAVLNTASNVNIFPSTSTPTSGTATVTSTDQAAAKVSPGTSPAQVVQLFLNPPSSKKAPVFTPNRTTNTTQPKTAIIGGCGGGCCQYCRTCYENENTCGLPSCHKTFPSKQALRKHYYFNPTHALRIPVEKASMACENFLPLELTELHRKARLREIFKRIEDDELKELLLPRLAKIVSLFQLLEQKSLRVSVGNVSAFKMFTEFERFRKEVEAKLLELILLPQGKSRGKSCNNNNELNNDKKAETKSTQGDQTTVGAVEHDGKGSPSSGTSSSSKPSTNVNSSVASSNATKQTVETICIDSEVEVSTAKTTPEAAKAGSQSESMEVASSPVDKGDASNEEVPGTVTASSGSAEDKKTSVAEDSAANTKDKAANIGLQPSSMEEVSSPVDKADANADEVPGAVTASDGTAEDNMTSIAEDSAAKTTDEAANIGLQPSSVDEVNSPVDKADANADEVPSAVTASDGSAEDKKTSVPEDSAAKTTDKAANIGLQPSSVEEVSFPVDKADANADEVPAGSASAEDKETCDSPSVEKNFEQSGKESGDVEQCSQPGSATKPGESLPSEGNESKEGEPSSAPQSIGANQDTSDSQLPESKQPAKDAGHIADKSTPKDSTSAPMETDELPPQHVTTGNSGLSEVQPSDVIMADQEEADSTNQDGKTKSSDREPEKESRNDTVMEMETPMEKEKSSGEVDSSGEVSQGAEDSHKEQSEKPPDLVDKESEKPKADSEDKRQQQTVQNQSGGGHEGDKKEVDKNAGVTIPGSSEETPVVSMTTDKTEGESSKVEDQVSKNSTASSEKMSLEKGEDQVTEVTSDKDGKTNEDSTKQKETHEPTASSTEAATSSSNTTHSSDAGDTSPAGSSTSKTEAASDEKEDIATKKRTLRETLDDLILEDMDEIDENNLVDLSLPFAIKWGRVIKKVKDDEAKKIARKENYSDQDMKDFIFHKPKVAANAVIIADCHAHPSFFRAYVMPALLDKHIDDFGVFGKKLLSRLYLTQHKYVRVLRSSIGPELAKILGINIFPTYKRIQDTWAIVKRPGGTATPSATTVFTIGAEDDREVLDDADGTATAAKTIGPSAKNLHQFVQSHADRVKECLKRSAPNINTPDGNKKQRLESSDAKKDASQTKESNKESAPGNSGTTAQKEVSRPNEKQKKPGETGSTKHDAQSDKTQPDESNKDQTKASDKTATPDTTGSASSTSASGKETSAPQESVESIDGPDTDNDEPMSVDQEQEQDAESSDVQAKGSSVAVEKSTSSPSSAQTASNASCSTDQPKTTAAKTCVSSIIPSKATIYTTPGSKKGAPSVPFPVSKGSPLFLVPIEKISPKLIDQFIQQATGEGVKTRSSDKKKGKQPKQTSKEKQATQVLVLFPSSNPNGSPTIQTLTSTEQLESTGDRKPLLLLPADKVPKTIANQSQTVRRKMVITMVASSSSAKSAATSAPSLTAASTSTAGGQSGDPTSPVQSVKGPIMSTQEGKTNTTSTDDSSVTPAASSDASKSVKNLTLVVNNTSALNSPVKDSLPAGEKSGSSEPIDVDEYDPENVTGSNESSSQAKQLSQSSPVSDAVQESSTVKESDSHKQSTSNQDSEPAASKAAVSATASSETDIDDNRSTTSSTGLDLLGSSLLPSDATLDDLLKDMTGDGTDIEASDMPPLDLSEIISSFEDVPAESESNTPVSATLSDTVSDRGATGGSAQGTSDSQMLSSIQGKPHLEDDSYATTRRQSPRRTPAPPKSASGSSSKDASDTEGEAEASGVSSHEYSLRKTSSPGPSGASKEDSDVEEGSPPRKRRRGPIRTYTRSSPQVTFVSDQGVPAKGSHGSPAKTKGKKQ